MYSDKSFKFVLSGSFPISSLSYSLLSIVSVVLILLDLNHMSLCFIIQFPGYLVNLIIPFFQLTSGLCLTNQLCPRNMSVPSRSITAASKVSLCLLISISRDATLVTSLFFVPLALNTSKEKFIGLVWILLSLTSCSSIPVYIQPESTNAFTFNFLPFFVLTFACIFNFFFPSLAWQFGIIYLLFWEFTWEISCTMPTQDLCQNSVCSVCLYHLILLAPSISSSSVFLCNFWQYAPSCCT